MRQFPTAIFAGVVAVFMSSPMIPAQERATTPDFMPVTDEALENPNAKNWLMWRRTYNSWGHSPLKQINTENVRNLTLAWAWTQEPGNQEAAPLVHNGIMYLAQSNNVVHALDAANGDLIWEYRHPLPELKGSYVKRQLLRSRNAVALYEDKVYLATGDARLVALDARTGQAVWNVAVADYKVGYNYAGGPLVVKGKIIAGISGCTTPDTGGGCFITAHDAKTGKELWRTHTIARAGDPANKTWNGIPVEERLGGSAWNTGAYDPELNLIFWGTAPPVPHSELARGSKEAAMLYTNSTLSLDPNNGQIVWHFQHLPSDNWNLDHAFERVLVDIEHGNGNRPILLTAGKTAVVWALNRKTGEYLWSTPTVHQKVGRIEAIDVTTGKTIWRHERRPIISSGLLTTDGGLVIGGDAGRRVFALDAERGTVLWEMLLNSSIGGFPMTYMVNSVQYLAVPTGSNKLAQFSAPLTPESVAPADREQGKGSTLMVFRLPDVVR